MIEVKFPIMFRHYQIDYVEDAQENSEYQASDCRGVVVACGSTLAALVLAVMSLDQQAELAKLFLERKLPSMDHLKDLSREIEEDDAAVALLIPRYMDSGGRTH